jgi:phosphotransferase system HPr (HPr) family protein
MQRAKLKVTNPVGLHARPASEFVRTATLFQSSISVCNLTAASPVVDAKSILSVLTLGVESGHEIELSADGPDEAQALRALRDLIESELSGKA